MPCQPVIWKGREWIGRDFEGLELCHRNHNQHEGMAVIWTSMPMVRGYMSLDVQILI